MVIVTIVFFALLVGSAMSLLHSFESDTLYPTDSVRNAGALYPMGGNHPPSRIHHTATYVDVYVIVFGGLSIEGEFLDDVNLFDTRSKTWSGPILKRLCCNTDGSIIEALGSDQESIDTLPSLKVGLEGDLPSARAEHTAVAAGGLLHLFGGLAEDGFMNDVYRFDHIALRWSIVDTSIGPMPARRAGHSAAERDVNQFIVFGGRTGNVLNYLEDTRMLNDVWNFNKVEQRWTYLVATSTESPCPRQYAATAVMDDRLYAFGGYDALSDIVFNDMWMFDLLAQTWSMLSPNSGYVEGYAPPPLHSSRLIPIVEYDGQSSTAVGGSDENLRKQGFLVYGGLGGGAACRGALCKSVAVSIGQVYKFEIILDSFLDNSTAKILNSALAATSDESLVRNYVKSSGWRYARLSQEDNNGESGEDSVYRGGKRIKRYVLEAVALSLDRKIMYEFGGLEAVDEALTDNSQTLRNRDGFVRLRKPVFMSSGGYIKDIASDLESGEKLRTSVDIPFNGMWHYSQSFVRSQPLEKSDFVSFLNEFRTYRIHPIDIVHLFQT